MTAWILDYRPCTVIVSNVEEAKTIADFYNYHHSDDEGGYDFLYEDSIDYPVMVYAGNCPSTNCAGYFWRYDHIPDATSVGEFITSNKEK